VNASIQALAAQGVAIKEIMRRTDKSRGLVRQVVRGARTDMFRSRVSSLEPFLTRLEAAWADGCRHGAALWRAMKIEGFTGDLRVVTEWATRKRKEEGTETHDKRPGKAPSTRRIAQMMTTDRDKVSKTVARTVAIIGEAVPDLTTARDLLDRFHRIEIFSPSRVVAFSLTRPRNKAGYAGLYHSIEPNACRYVVANFSHGVFR
jgi:hypothetical protein